MELFPTFRVSMHMPRLLLVFLTIGLLSHAAQATTPCIIEAKEASIEDLVIRLPGEKAFSITIDKSLVELTPTRRGRGKLHVLEPLIFSTSHKLNDAGIQLKEKMTLLGGRLTLARGLVPRSFANKVDSSDESRIGIQVSLKQFKPISTISVPCSGLTIKNNTDTHVNLNNRVYRVQTERHLSIRTKFRLYAQPQKSSPFWIRFHGPLYVTKTQGKWIQLQAKWNDGSSLQGWIPRYLARFKYSNPITYSGYSYRRYLKCGENDLPALKTVTLEAGAPIHSKPDGATWAKVANTVKASVSVETSADEWVRIVSLPSLLATRCQGHDHIWIRSKYVSQ